MGEGFCQAQRAFRKVETPVKRKILFVFLGVMVIWGAFLSAMMATDPGDNLVVSGARLVTGEGGDKVISGTVINKADRSYADVRVTIEPYDSLSIPLEPATVIVGSLESRERSSFGAAVDGRTVGFTISVSSPENTRPSWFGECSTTFCQIFR